MFEEQLEEVLDYVFGKKEEVYCIYNCSTNSSITGNLDFILSYIIFLKESFSLPDSNWKIMVANVTNLETLRNIDDEITLAVIERK